MKYFSVVSPSQGCVELQECHVADPGPKEIQVNVHASVISPGTERAWILNLSNTPGQYPFEPGYCTAGVVEKTGSEVTEFSAGDRVACFSIPHRSMGNVSEDKAVRIPEGVSFEDAAFHPLGQIALQGVRKARIELGEEVMVIGLGIIGQLALQLASLNGAIRLIGVDRIDGRMKIALECGAGEVFNSSEPGWMDKIKDKPQIVIESTGSSDAIISALQAASLAGRIILLGSARGDSTVNFNVDVHRKVTSIIGAHAFAGAPKYESRPGQWTWKSDSECIMKLLQKRKIRLEPLVTNKVNWQNVEETYKEIIQWNTDMIGTIIQWK